MRMGRKKEFFAAVIGIHKVGAAYVPIDPEYPKERIEYMLQDWGAKEVLITHNTEAIVCDGSKICRAPLRPRNLSGRTGRGDTTFAGYLCERLDHDIPTALEFAAALVSLKMETPGVFKGSIQDVEDYIREFYQA